ncbi:MAG: hypothetical protein J6M92_06925, partial [Oribacterium sp.]|nr:hypothetical protein [Oribacterium sp.]
RSRVPPTFRTLRPINRPFVLHVGRVMKSILHFCASTSGGRLMTLISYRYYVYMLLSIVMFVPLMVAMFQIKTTRLFLWSH